MVFAVDDLNITAKWPPGEAVFDVGFAAEEAVAAQLLRMVAGPSFLVVDEGSFARQMMPRSSSARPM